MFLDLYNLQSGPLSNTAMLLLELIINDQQYKGEQRQFTKFLFEFCPIAMVYNNIRPAWTIRFLFYQVSNTYFKPY